MPCGEVDSYLLRKLVDDSQIFLIFSCYNINMEQTILLTPEELQAFTDWVSDDDPDDLVHSYVRMAVHPAKYRQELVDQLKQYKDSKQYPLMSSVYYKFAASVPG